MRALPARETPPRRPPRADRAGQLAVSRYLQVAFNLPLQQTFTYLDLDDAATRPGVRVVAPFGRRRVTGFVIGAPRRAPPDVTLRAIARRVDEQPVFDRALLELARWVGRHLPVRGR